MNEYNDWANSKGWTHRSDEEVNTEKKVYNLFQNCPVYSGEILSNLGLFLNTKTFARLLFANEVYRRIVDIPGVVMEFGVEWGGNLATFSALRGIYEPYNVRRKIIGFDTFEGFPHVDEKDGNAPLIGVGNLSLPEHYIDYLDQIMDLQEKNQPLSHIKKYELVKGDACVTVPKYLEEHPETVISLAYFDFDLYEPTKVVLNTIKDRLIKGSIIGFDELNDPSCPGETLAVMETLGLDKLRLKKVPWCTKPCWFELE